MDILGKYWYVWTSALLLVIIVAVSILELAEHPAQRAAKDMSCHNPFRYSSDKVIVPKLDVDLNITEAEWPRLTALLRRFSRAHGWSFRDKSVRIPGKVNALNLSLCTDDWQNIVAFENRWKGSHAYDGRGLPIMLYANVKPAQWQRSARDLVRTLRKEWPDRVGFRDKGGYLLKSPPRFLEESESQH